jgi:DNA-3-methyladenine glycosylase I
MDLSDGTITGADGITRCWWCGGDPLYVAYHDREWGRPLRDERALFELLCLEGFQAGLSWITILRKRVAFREAFDGFDPVVVARYGEPDVDRLLANPAIVRHRGKITATIANAQAVVAMEAAGTSLKQVVWTHAPVARPRPLTSRDDLPAQTPASAELAHTLRKWGMRFVGATTTYAFMQSAGLVDDHIAGCHRAGGAGPTLRTGSRLAEPLPPPVKRPKRPKRPTEA